MLFAITSFLLIVFILSYLILKFIYRIIFKSKKKISKILVFLGGIGLCIGLVVFYYTPYSFYLEPSFWQFREICKLDPEIYQANGGKLDEEYYNKILGYFNLNLDTLDYSKFQETTTLNFYQQKPPYKKMKIANENLYYYYPLGILYKTDISDRISLSVGITFNNDKPNNKQDVESVSISPKWQTYRIQGFFWDISTSGDFGMPTKVLYCDDLRYLENKDKQ